MHTHYSYVTAIFCVNGRGVLPYIDTSISRCLERDHKVVWTSALGQSDDMLSSSRLGNGRLFPVVRKLWENQVTRRCLPTLHLLNGILVAVGEYVSPVCPGSPDRFIDVGAQTYIATQDRCSQTDDFSLSLQSCRAADDISSLPSPDTIVCSVSSTSVAGAVRKELSAYENGFQDIHELLAELSDLSAPPLEGDAGVTTVLPPPQLSPPHLTSLPSCTSGEDMDADVWRPPPSNLTEYEIVDTWIPTPSPTAFHEEDVLFLYCNDGLDDGLDLFK